MTEARSGDLLKFIVPTEEPLRVLVLESVSYLPALRDRLPQGEIYAAVQDDEVAREAAYTNLGVHWVTVDYLAEPLPFDHESFDIIMGDQCLEQAGNPQDIASGLGLYLKETGCFLTTFTNARYWRVVRNLMQGHFYHICSHIFSKNEMMSLLFASFYKDASFAPVEDDYGTDGEFIQSLEEFGFENIDGDLGVRTWMVMATKSSAEILELKRFFTKEIRRQLVTLLRRIEYGIQLRDNVPALLDLIRREQIFTAYLANFILETIMHTDNFLGHLLPALLSCREGDLARELVDELVEAYVFHHERDVVQRWQERLEAGELLSAEDTVGERQSAPGVDLTKLPPDKKVAFITCVNNEELYHECQLYINHLRVPEGMAIEFVPVRGAVSMCQGYNEGMGRTEAKYKVYIHQDTLVVNPDFISDMLKIFSDDQVGAFGVIGCRSLPASGIWWDGLRKMGRVLHACESESVVDTICQEFDGDYIEVEAVDGLIMVTSQDIAWREDLFTGWHFYEISQCKEMQRKGYKVVVPQQDSYWCIHSPKEKPLDPSYKTYQKIFLKEYGKELDPEI